MLRVTRVLTALLVAALLLAGTGAAAAAYSPAPGALFNNPRGTAAAKNRILTQLVRAINATPRNARIQIAAYSNDRMDVADALIKAHRRGVDVQMVLNDNWTSRATRRLARVLGTDPNRRSFVRICAGSCRGGRGNQHMKFYLFSRTGKARNVVMVGSANLTGYGARSQWNDMFTVVGADDLRQLYVTVFEQLVRDRRVADPYIHRTVGIYENEFYPFPDPSPQTDPVMRRLAGVRCAAGGGTGVRGHTTLRIVMYGWGKERGIYLADRVAELSRAGCDIRALLSAPGRRVVTRLKRAGVLVKSADLDLDDNEDTGFDQTPYEVFTHEKYMALSGSYRQKMGYQVWTGSENWSGMGLINDEVTLRVPRQAAYNAYLANFTYIWSHHSRWL